MEVQCTYDGATWRARAARGAERLRLVAHGVAWPWVREREILGRTKVLVLPFVCPMRILRARTTYNRS